MRVFLRPLGCLVVGFFLLIVTVCLASWLSPWPKCMLIRYVFTQGGQATAAALQKHVPPNVDALLDQSYLPGDKDARLDVFYPAGTKEALPTIVWIHGGAFIAGAKEEIASYLKVLAAEGFTVVSLEYSLAPEKCYPTPPTQLNAALGFILQNSQKFQVDPSRLMLAGDSAGSQLAAQQALLITNPDYARMLQLHPSLEPEQLRGIILNCGVYDYKLHESDSGFIQSVLWAYSGRKDFRSDEFFKTFNVLDHLTPRFPPALVTCGNNDPLEMHSRALVTKLEEMNVPLETVLFEKSYEPKLAHEYQFNLDSKEGKDTLARILAFARARLDAPGSGSSTRPGTGKQASAGGQTRAGPAKASSAASRLPERADPTR